MTSIQGASSHSYGLMKQNMEPVARNTAEAPHAKSSNTPDKSPASDPASILTLSEESKALASNDTDSGLKRAHTGIDFENMREQARELLLIGSVQRRNPEAVEGLREALANGTVQTRMAKDVPGVNYVTNVTITQGPNGPIEKHTATFNPSPEIQAALDEGKAAVMWQRGVGDVYLTW